MMKSYKRYLNTLLGIMIIWGLASCDNDEFTYDGPQVEAGPDVTVSAPSPAVGNSIVEPEIGETVQFTFSVTLSSPYEARINVVSEVDTSSTATAGVDFETSNVLINAPAGATEGEITLTLIGDGEIEETERVKVLIGTDLTANVSSMSGQVVEFDLLNWESPVFESYTAWEFADGSEDFNGETAEDLLDLDIYLIDIDASDTIEVAGTGSFEHLTTPELDDGDYLLSANLWAVFDPGTFGPLEFVIIQEFEQFGKILRYELPVTAAPSTDDEDGVSNYDLGIIRVTGGVYTTLTIDEFESLKKGD